MMKKTLIASVVAAGMLTVAGVSAAADWSGFQGKGAGFYAGANVGMAHADWKTSTTGDSISNKWDATYGLLAGYMFNSNLGVEFNYDFYQKTTEKNSVGNEVYSYKRQNYPSLLAVFNLPVTQQWNAFAKLGVAYLTPKSDATAPTSGDTTNPVSDTEYKVWAPVVAFGAGYDITQNVQLTAQYKHVMNLTNASRQSNDNSPNYYTPNYDAFTVGVNYMF